MARDPPWSCPIGYHEVTLRKFVSSLAILPRSTLPSNSGHKMGCWEFEHVRSRQTQPLVCLPWVVTRVRDRNTWMTTYSSMLGSKSLRKHCCIRASISLLRHAKGEAQRHKGTKAQCQNDARLYIRRTSYRQRAKRGFVVKALRDIIAVRCRSCGNLTASNPG